MKILLDVQGVQTEARYRGIGNYTRQLATALCRNISTEDEIHILLNGTHPDLENTIQVRKYFSKFVPKENIHNWYSPFVLPYTENEKNIQMVDHIYSEYVNYLNPDAFVTLSFMERPGAFFVTFNNIRKSIVKASVVYDYIPKKWTDWPHKDWYNHQLLKLAKADLLLAISDYVHQQNLELYPSIKSIDIETDVSQNYNKIKNENFWLLVREKYQLYKPYFLYSGSLDHRKNVGILLAAYSLLPTELKNQIDCVIVSGKTTSLQEQVKSQAINHGLKSFDNIKFLNYVTDEELKALYQNTRCFIFPSFDEGFGMPILEAMRCGAAVIGARGTSIPGIIKNDEALFDPFNVNKLREKLEKIITDDAFHQLLITNGEIQQERYSWDNSAKLLLENLRNEKKHNTSDAVLFNFRNVLEKIKLIVDKRDVISVSRAIAKTYDFPSIRRIFIDLSEHEKYNKEYQVIIKELLANQDRAQIKETQLIPIKWSNATGCFVYAPHLALEYIDKFLDIPGGSPIDYSENDIIFELDMECVENKKKYNVLKTFQAHGVRLVFYLNQKELEKLALDNQKIIDIMSGDGLIVSSDCVNEKFQSIENNLARVSNSDKKIRIMGLSLQNLTSL